MYNIPKSIFIKNTEYRIRNDGDYRTILDCFAALQDSDLTKHERLFASLIIFYSDLNSIEGVLNDENLESRTEEMYKFFNCGDDTPIGTKVPHKLIDWEQDSQLISSAVNKVAGVEIRSVPYIHWWTFMGYFSAIDKSLLSTVISIRDKMIRGKSLEKYERTFRAENPRYFVWNSKSVDEEEADKILKDLWNNGG